MLFPVLDKSRAIAWQIGNEVLPCRPSPLIMGIVNVTPDSFFDGGKHNTPEQAYEQGMTEKNVEPRTPSLEPRTSIVTAHHAGDQAETMFMRLRRGTTLAGLRGIQPLRAMSYELSAMSCEQSAMSNEEKEIPASAGMTEECVANQASRHKPCASSPEPRASSLLRPLLNVTREDLLAS